MGAVQGGEAGAARCGEVKRALGMRSGWEGEQQDGAKPGAGTWGRQ